MTDFGRERAWQENERNAERVAKWVSKHSPGSYTATNRWWKAHLKYCESLPGFTVRQWLEIMLAWAEDRCDAEAQEELYLLSKERAIDKVERKEEV